MDCCFSCLGAKKKKKPPSTEKKPQIPPAEGDPPLPAIPFPAVTFLFSCSATTGDSFHFARFKEYSAVSARPVEILSSDLLLRLSLHSRSWFLVHDLCLVPQNFTRSVRELGSEIGLILPQESKRFPQKTATCWRNSGRG